MKKEYIFNNFLFKLDSWSPGGEYNKYKHIIHNIKLTLNQSLIMGAILVSLKYPLKSTPLLPPPRHLLNIHLSAYNTALLWDRRGRCAWTPSGSCARFYYIT